MRFLLATILMLLLFGSLNVRANEPLWTEAERMAKSEAVFIGVVQSVRKVRELNKQENLFSATVKVREVKKNHALIADQKVTLYFARPKDGRSDKRCPAYVELSEKQSSVFYVRIQEVGREKLPFLEMDSDVHPSK